MFIVRPNSLGTILRRHFWSLVPFVTPRKAANIALASAEMLLRRERCFSRPFMFRVDPCTACNLRCASCEAYSTRTRTKRVMDPADFATIVDKIRDTALRTSLYDVGEPLMNRDIYKMIGYASDRGISTLISTNFNLFGPENLDDLFASRLTVLEPCLDGFTQETYATYRRGGSVEKVKEGIRAVMGEKRRRKSRWPILDVQTVLFKHLLGELGQIEAFLKENGVDHVTFREENLGFDAEGEKKVANPQTRAAGHKPCFWLYLGMVVRPDGSVYPCCGGGYDRFAYGNILKQDLSEIWNNKYYRFSRALFDQGADLPYDEEMRDIPCFTCRPFRIRRGMRPAGG